MSSAEPVWGNHECWAASVSPSDCNIPIPIPATTVGTISSKRPTAAAASAGTTASV